MAVAATVVACQPTPRFALLVVHAKHQIFFLPPLLTTNTAERCTQLLAGLN
jgi:hypothetical protein